MASSPPTLHFATGRPEFSPVIDVAYPLSNLTIVLWKNTSEGCGIICDQLLFSRKRRRSKTKTTIFVTFVHVNSLWTEFGMKMIWLKKKRIRYFFVSLEEGGDSGRRRKWCRWLNAVIGQWCVVMMTDTVMMVTGRRWWRWRSLMNSTVLLKVIATTESFRTNGARERT